MKNLLSKKYVDMTMGDMFKVSGVITLASMGVMAIGYVIAAVYEKKQDEKWRKSLTNNSETEIDD